MPRPRVLIRASDPAVTEILRSDIVRAGGTPASDGAAPIVILAGSSIGELAVAGKKLPKPAEVIVLHNGEPGIGPLFDVVCHSRVSHYINEQALDYVLYPCIRKLLSGDIFGLDKYLPAAPTRRLRIDSYAGRGLALDAVMRASNELGLRRPLREKLSSVAEELLINGLYEAPVDQEGRKVFADVPPRERLTQRSPRPVSLRYASTDQFFAIAVRDRYGQMRKQDVFEALTHARGQPAVADSRVLGSGRGLFRVAQHATTIAINVAPGVATEVVCTFARDEQTHRAFGFFAHRGADA